MPDTAVNRRRGTTVQHAAFTGLVGETTYNTDVKILVAHDGATAGGFPAAHLHVANIFSQPQTISVLSGAPTTAFDILTDSVSRVTFRKSGFGILHRQEADVSPGGLELSKRGTTGNALAALSSGSAISTIDFLGWDGAALGGAGGIRSYTNQAWVPGAHGSKLFFTTVPAGSTATVNSMELDNTALTVLSRLLLPNTTSATVGGIYFGGTRAVHNFGTSNFFAGVGAGNLTMTGIENTAVGAAALDANTTGDYGVAFGSNSLSANTTGDFNNGFGAYTLASNTTGALNTAVGHGAMFANVSGSNNTGLGGNALFDNTGSFNMAIGTGALQNNTTGGSNSAVGYLALETNLIGSNNVAIGSLGLRLCTGSNNLAIGTAAGKNITSGSNNIVIGYNIDSPTSTNSNTLTLGNLIFGTGVDGVDTAISSGLVGIKVITPLTEFHVVSTSASDPRGIMSAQHSTDAIGARIHFRKSRGTPTVPTTIVTGDVLGRLRFSGYDGTNYLQMGSIDVTSVGTIAATRVPTFMAFSTATDVAPSVLTEGFRLTQLQTLLMATGKALAMASGANQRAGNAVLVAGTVTVANTTVTANTIVLLTRKTSGGTIGLAITYTVSAATSFTITSDSAIDTSTFSYILVEVP